MVPVFNVNKTAGLVRFGFALWFCTTVDGLILFVLHLPCVYVSVCKTSRALFDCIAFDSGFVIFFFFFFVLFVFGSLSNRNMFQTHCVKIKYEPHAFMLIQTRNVHNNLWIRHWILKHHSTWSIWKLCFWWKIILSIILWIMEWHESLFVRNWNVL